MSDQAIVQSTDTKNQSEKIKIKEDGVEKEITLTEAEKVELIQKGRDYTRKTQAVAEKEKAVDAQKAELSEMKRYWDEMKADPGLNQALRKTHEDYKAGRISKAEEKARNLKTIDKEIEEAEDRGDLEGAKSLTKVRKIIEEVSGSKEVQERMKKMEDELAFLRNSTLMNLDAKIDADLNRLKQNDEYGKDLVEKYEKQVRESAIKYPNQSVEKLFKYFASDDSDFDEALLNRAKKKKEKEIQRKSNGSSGGGTSTVTPIEPVKDSKGRTDWKLTFGKWKESGRI